MLLTVKCLNNLPIASILRLAGLGREGYISPNIRHCLRFDTHKHAKSCKAMLLTMNTIGIHKSSFLKYRYSVFKTVPVYSQRTLSVTSAH